MSPQGQARTAACSVSDAEGPRLETTTLWNKYKSIREHGISRGGLE
jgi:hypothetical protein